MTLCLRQSYSVWLTLVVGVCVSHAAADSPIDEAAAWMAEHESLWSTRSIESEFVQTIHAAGPASRELDGQYDTSVRFLASKYSTAGAHWRLESVRLDAGRPVYSTRLVDLWDGEKAVRTRHDLRLYEVTATPNASHDLKYLSLFHGQTIPTWIATIPLSEFLVRSRLVAHHLDGSIERFTVIYGSGSVTVDLEFDKSFMPPQISLLRTSRSIDTTYGTAKVVNEYRVEEWGYYQGVPLPRRAVRTGSTFPRTDDGLDLEPIVFVVRLNRQNAVIRGLDDVSFDMTFENGWEVADGRLGMNFFIGDYDVVLDGYDFTVDRPVTPGDVSYVTTFRPSSSGSDASVGERPAMEVPATSPGSSSNKRAIILLAFVLIALVLLLKSGRVETPHFGRARKMAIMPLVVVGLALVIGVIVWSIRSGSEPALAGSVSHDFGHLPLPPARVELSHTFVLVNRGKHPIAVRDTRTSCGCTLVHTPKASVAPGDALEVEAKLELTQGGYRKERIWLLFEDGGSQELTLSVTGVPQAVISSTHGSVLVLDDHQSTVLLVAKKHDDFSPPPDPKISSPVGVDARFGGWYEVYSSDASIGRPSRWHGQISLGGAVDETQSRPFLSVSLEEFEKDHLLEINLLGRPW